VDQSGDQQPASHAKRDAQSAPLKRKTPGQVGYGACSWHLGVKGSQVQILSARRNERAGGHEGRKATTCPPALSLLAAVYWGPRARGAPGAVPSAARAGVWGSGWGAARRGNGSHAMQHVVALCKASQASELVDLFVGSIAFESERRMMPFDGVRRQCCSGPWPDRPT